ncbi:MAG: diacylglycerol kinase family protein [Rhizobiales bacterium]|nr:diacylglycerol kinase family protein [Hyphomicrobiales bacterium]
MVCCILLSLLIGSFLWIFKFIGNTKLQADQKPLEWRLFSVEPISLNSLEEKQFSVRARLKSFSYAANGLNIMLKTEHNCWVHLTVTILVFSSALLLQISVSDWRWLVLAISIVWIAEAINTALEYLCDVVSPDLNSGIKAAKDIAAGAVLISAICAASLGLLTFFPYIESSIQNFANADFFICKAFQKN